MQIKPRKNHQQYFFLIIVLMLFGLTIYSCSDKINPPESDQSKEVLTKIRFPGTKAFAEMPPGYVWEKEKEIYRFGDTDNFLLCKYFPEAFGEMKKGWQAESSSISDMRMDSYQVEGKEVMTVQGYNSQEKKQSYILMMEADYHSIILLAQIIDTTLITQMNVSSIIESLRHVDTFDLDLFELADYQFDENITGFYYYLRIGREDGITFLRDRIKDMDNLGPERIVVGGVEKLTDERVEELLEGTNRNSSYIVIASARTDKLINNLKVSIQEIDYIFKDQPSFGLYAIIRGLEKDYIFYARTNRDIEEMKKKFRATLETFEVK